MTRSISFDNDNKMICHGDGGIDIIAFLKDLEILIQCKCLSKSVSVGTVREMQGILSGKKGKIGCIVANNNFSEYAKTQALNSRPKILLVNENNICDEIKKYYDELINNQSIDEIINMKIESIEEFNFLNLIFKKLVNVEINLCK